VKLKLELTSLLTAEFFAFSKLEVPELVEGFSIEGATNSPDMIAVSVKCCNCVVKGEES
jgi:hypothetical protein